MVLIAGLTTCGLFPGSGAVAAETGQGTLGFLTSLPSGRGRVWLAKAVAGLLIMTASCLAMVAAFSLTDLALWGREGAGVVQLAMTELFGTGPSTLVFVLMAVYGYAVSLLCSTLVDRATTAAVIALIIGLGLAAGMESFSSYLISFDSRRANMVLDVMFGVSIAALFTASFAAFTMGDTLKTIRHVAIAGSVLLGWIVVGGITLGVYSVQARSIHERGLTLSSKLAIKAYLSSFPVKETFTPSIASVVMDGRGTVGITVAKMTEPGRAYQSMTVTLDRAEIGHAYAFTIGLQPSQPGIIPQPVSIKHSHGIARASFFRIPGIPGPVYISDRFGNRALATKGVPPGYQIGINYLPDHPLGPDKQTLEVLDKGRHVIGNVTLIARKIPSVGHRRIIPHLSPSGESASMARVEIGGPKKP